MSKHNPEHSLIGKLLLAMPGMSDPRFHRAVIFVCAHDKNGAMGLVINSVLTGIDMKGLLEQLKISPEARSELTNLSIPVMAGGPVEGSRGFILHTTDFRQKDTVYVGDDYAVTGTIEALKAIAAGTGPKDLIFMLGYAGWGAGQLDNEIQDNSWLVVDPDPNTVFKTPSEDMWETAVHKLGFDPVMLSSEAGHA